MAFYLLFLSFLYHLYLSTYPVGSSTPVHTPYISASQKPKTQELSSSTKLQHPSYALHARSDDGMSMSESFACMHAYACARIVVVDVATPIHTLPLHVPSQILQASSCIRFLIRCCVNYSVTVKKMVVWLFIDLSWWLIRTLLAGGLRWEVNYYYIGVVKRPW